MAYETAQNDPIANGPAKAAADLQDALAQTAECHRVLTEEWTQHAKDETLRFWNLRLDRTSAVFGRMQDCQGVGGLIAAQQEWAQDFWKDYADHSMRVLGAMRGMAHDAAVSASQVAEDTVAHVRKTDEQAMEDAKAVVSNGSDEGEMAAETHH